MKCTSCYHEFGEKISSFHVCPNCHHVNIAPSPLSGYTTHGYAVKRWHPKRLLKSKRFYPIILASVLLTLLGFGVAQSGLGGKEEPAPPQANPIVAATPKTAEPPNPIISNALCRVDVSLAVELIDIAKNMANTCLTAFPKIEQLLGASPYPVPHSIKLTHSTYAIGYASGNEVTIQIEYIRDHPDDIGMLVHELTHVIQAYPGGPSWVTEGVADYVRHELGYTSAQNYVCNSSNDYSSGYNCAANLLSYVQRTHNANIIKELHAVMRNNTYTDTFFAQKTGKTLSQLYSLCRSYDCKGGKP